MKMKILVVTFLLSVLAGYFVFIFMFPEFAPRIGPIGPEGVPDVSFVLLPQDFLFLFIVVGIPSVLMVVILKVKKRKGRKMP